MVSVLASSAEDCGFESRSGQTKYYKIGICNFSYKADIKFKHILLVEMCKKDKTQVNIGHHYHIMPNADVFILCASHFSFPFVHYYHAPMLDRSAIKRDPLF